MTLSDTYYCTLYFDCPSQYTTNCTFYYSYDITYADDSSSSDSVGGVVGGVVGFIVVLVVVLACIKCCRNCQRRRRGVPVTATVIMQPQPGMRCGALFLLSFSLIAGFLVCQSLFPCFPPSFVHSSMFCFVFFGMVAEFRAVAVAVPVISTVIMQPQPARQAVPCFPALSWLFSLSSSVRDRFSSSNLSFLLSFQLVFGREWGRVQYSCCAVPLDSRCGASAR